MFIVPDHFCWCYFCICLSLMFKWGLANHNCTFILVSVPCTVSLQLCLKAWGCLSLLSLFASLPSVASILLIALRHHPSLLKLYEYLNTPIVFFLLTPFFYFFAFCHILCHILYVAYMFASHSTFPLFLGLYLYFSTLFDFPHSGGTPSRCILFNLFHLLNLIISKWLTQSSQRGRREGPRGHMLWDGVEGPLEEKLCGPWLFVSELDRVNSLVCTLISPWFHYCSVTANASPIFPPDSSSNPQKYPA